MTFRRYTLEPRAPRPVSRRDFLRLEVSEGRQVLELSCERLFMRYHDACSDAARRQVSNHDDLPACEAPATGHALPSVAALLAELDRRLADADELRVTERSWLGDGALARAVLERIGAFRRRGGRVDPDDLVSPELGETGK